jgi:hypothetical protein
MQEISFQDIKKAYVSKASALETTLCYSGTVVNVKPIKMRDKKEFLKAIETESEENVEIFVDNMIEKYVTDKSDNQLNAKQLVDQERYQLLMLIRKHSTTQDTVHIDHICPKCGELNNNIQFEFGNISVKQYVCPDGVEDTIKSRNGNIEYVIGMLTRGEIYDIEKYIKEKKIESKVEKDFVYMSCSIKEIYKIDDEVRTKYIPKISERIEFAENISFDEFEKIRKYFEKQESFGVVMPFSFKCSKCEFANEKEEAKIINFFIA